MINCTCLSFNFAMIEQLSQRNDLNLVIDNNPCILELSHVIPVVKENNKVVALSNIVTKCVFLSYKESDTDLAVAFVAMFPNKLQWRTKFLGQLTRSALIFPPFPLSPKQCCSLCTPVDFTLS